MKGKKAIKNPSDNKQPSTPKNTFKNPSSKISVLLICQSIKSPSEPHSRCLMKAIIGKKYCPLHLGQKNIRDYVTNINDNDDDIEINLEKEDVVMNPVMRKIDINNFYEKKNVIMKTKKTKCNKKSTMIEQKVSTIKNCYNENEDDLAIKLLILVNNDEYCDEISKLVGPVFKDVTLSEDEQDPVTLDTIWTLNNGKKVAASVNKYYLFSYLDSKNKIRCLTIFTIYNMIQSQTYQHPITMEDIPETDICRAKKLIDLYQTKIDLFRKQDDSNLSLEYIVRNRLTKLFNKFHVFSIYLEENWLMSIDDKSQLLEIIKETSKLISNNIKSSNPRIAKLSFFQKKIGKTDTKRKGNKIQICDNDNSIIKLKEYIIDEWERLIEESDISHNQLPIWVLASGLSLVVPEVVQKYPSLEVIF